MAKNFYAVKNGRVPGIYTSWNECRAQVIGCAGAVYKGFETRAEAESFMGIEVSAPQSSSDCGAPSPEEGCAIAYVDGSFRESAGRFSYGIVMFINGGAETLELHFSKGFTNPELLEMRNVSGEIMGAAEAMRQTKERGLKKVTIYHDYEGVAKWCQGLWKANKPWVQKYKAFYDEMSRYIRIDFVKVKGHSDNKYNDLADELAKKGLEDEI